MGPLKNYVWLRDVTDLKEEEEWCDQHHPAGVMAEDWLVYRWQGRPEQIFSQLPLNISFTNFEQKYFKNIIKYF